MAPGTLPRPGRRAATATISTSRAGLQSRSRITARAQQHQTTNHKGKSRRKKAWGKQMKIYSFMLAKPPGKPSPWVDAPDTPRKKTRRGKRKRKKKFKLDVENAYTDICSANLKGCALRLRNLKTYLKSLKRAIDIILIQDPPKEFVTEQIANYDRWHFTAPRCDMDRVCFLVHKSIAGAWRVVRPDDCNAGMLATLELQTGCTNISIHNFYNRMTGMNIEKLLAVATSKPIDLLMGDSNLHARLWGGLDARNICKKGEQLERGVLAAGMKCLIEPGIVTYSRGRQNGSGDYETTIDTAFAGESLSKLVLNCEPLKVPGFNSDHRVIWLRIAMNQKRKPVRRQMWNRVDAGQYQQAMREALSSMDAPQLGSSDGIQGRINQFMGKWLAVIKKCVPVVRCYKQIAHRKHAQYILLRQDIEEAAAESLQNDPPHLQHYWAERAAHVARRIKTEKMKSWRHAVASSKKKSPHDIFRWARQAPRWVAPKDPLHTPDFEYNGETHRTEEAKADCFARSMWPKVKEKTKGSTAEPLSLPPLDPGRKQHTSSYHLKEAEVRRIITDMSHGKAAGPDGIRSDAFKLAKEVLVPFLTEIFQACLKLSYHPDNFKGAITVVIRKSGDRKASNPRSYRPIALLMQMGKILEKIIANRLRELAEKHDLLPKLQFGAPGGCTTKALQYMLYPVYKGWCAKKHLETTLMGLDITGAYDHVLRDKLLRALIAKGIPDWLVTFVWSFLCDRWTTLQMPGYLSKPYWVDVGIPQGSPLSPILFLFAASGILETFASTHSDRNIEISTFAYVDDTYLMVTSPSYDTNCKILKELHDLLMGWARPNGIEFSPQKYAILHFRKPYVRKSTPVCMFLPDIPGMAENKEKILVVPKITGKATANINTSEYQNSLRILGVHVDPRLKWTEHIAEIKAKVRSKVAHYSRFCGSTWGPTLQKMRRLYLQSVRTIITYACGAWFMFGHGGRWDLTVSLMKQLESLQYQCLVKISGAFQKTPYEVLLKELHIDRIETTLKSIAMVHRAKMLDGDLVKLMSLTCDSSASDPSESGPCSQPADTPPQNVNVAHPYESLFAHARQFEDHCRRKHRKDLGLKPFLKIWNDPKQRAEVLKTESKLLCAEESGRAWEAYRRRRQRKKTTLPVPFALKEGWGPESLQFYAGLPRAHSTMLVHCRTGRIGLNSYLFTCNSKKHTVAETNMCPCGEGMHTVEHLFLDCKQLKRERYELASRLHTKQVGLLLTVHAQYATDWAIRNFRIKQFEWTRTNLLFQ